MPHIKYFQFPVFAFVFLLSCSSPQNIALAETYAQAVTNVQANIDNNINFIPLASSIISIQGNPSTENSAFGLQYESYNGTQYLITRTFTKSKYYYGGGALTGVGDYTTTGAAATDASWVTTGNDATKFLVDNGVTPDNVVDLLERGLGMNNNASHNMIIEYAVLPNNDNLMRPTRQPDIKNYSTTSSDYAFNDPFVTSRPEDMDVTINGYLNTYLNNWQKDALGTLDGSGNPTWHDVRPQAGHEGWTRFPWTELGYTYFWDSGGTTLADVQGMSEFIILGNTKVKILGIYSPQSYIYTRNKNGAFSSDTDAQYGNGFGSFNVTNNCDTIWAGNAFQKRASTDPANPNQIVIASTATISAGQGILVWSPNYTITNYGTISGTTFNKLYYDAWNTGMSSTNDIALLFKGDTSFGDPGGKNIIINSGTISSPGTAIEIDAGDSQITNTGTISGDSYGIRLKSGTNSITNSGTIKTAVGGTAIRIESGTTSINSTQDIWGHVTLVSDPTVVFDIGNSTLTISNSSKGIYQQYSDTTLKITANSATDFGKIDANGNIANNAEVASDSNLSVRIGGYIPNSTVLSDVISAVSSGVYVPDTITSTSPIFTFAGSNGQISGVGGSYLDLTATRANSYNSFATNSNTSATGIVLNTLANNGVSGDMAVVLGALDSLTSGGQIDSALSALAPNTGNSSPQVNYETQSSFINTAVDHINTVFGVVGAVIPPGALDPAVWAQTFDTYIHQNPRGTSNGYNANIWGIIGGYDTQVSPNLAFGVSAGYARDEIRSKDFSARTQIDSYQLGVYGSFTRLAYYLDSVLSFAYNQYDASRKINFAGLERTPTSNYGGQQYSAYFEGGYNFDYHQLRLTPLASIQYTRLNIDGYTEKNAGAANLEVDPQGSDFLQSGLGAKIAYRIEKKDFSIIPDFHFKWLYSLINDNQQATSTFTGGGGSFTTSGFNLPTSSYNLGSKWTILAKNNISVSLNYDYEVKPDFFSHSGYINVRHEF
ncbi:MAG: autotransporter domain-containing protein [Candidatus Omnitrophica bacterium]|nr:autotransporter domain-containing protein [Candidatus Omnitrophota bacterium]